MPPPLLPCLHRLVRSKTTSAAHVAARHTDATFEKLMSNYKHLVKAYPVLDLLLASPSGSIPLAALASTAQRLRLNRGAAHFVRAFPRVFSVHPPLPLRLDLTPAARSALAAESSACSALAADAVNRIHRLLAMSLSHSLPLRSVFRVWRELGLPDDFEESVIASRPDLFRLRDNADEPNTHILELVSGSCTAFDACINKSRDRELSKASDTEIIKNGFKLQFPPGMRLSKEYRKKVKAWQRLPYAGPYENSNAIAVRRRRTKLAAREMEKRAVGIAHEFLSLTVEKMVEVEKISHFRKWFGIELNIRDLFLDHPGIFYLSAKGKRHTVFLREAYDRGRLIETNPIYEAREQLLKLMLLRRRGLGPTNANVTEIESSGTVEEKQTEDEEEFSN